jgi:hypothetical protein
MLRNWSSPDSTSPKSAPSAKRLTAWRRT